MEIVETIHLYVVRQQPKKPYTLLPLLCAFLCLLGIAAITFYSAAHPYYEHQQLTVPAVALPPKVFTAQAPIVPTGSKTYPATYADGFLTFSNGSVIGQSIPASFTVDGAATDRAVYVPAATANGFGMSTVSAHLLTSGINRSTLSINEVIGSSLFIRNLSPFTGGRPAYSVKYATAQDRLQAIVKARSMAANMVSGLHYLCQEGYASDNLKVSLSWRCQFITYRIPSYMHVARVQLIGTHVLLFVWYIPRPTHIWVK